MYGRIKLILSIICIIVIPIIYSILFITKMTCDNGMCYVQSYSDKSNDYISIINDRIDCTEMKFIIYGVLKGNNGKGAYLFTSRYLVSVLDKILCEKSYVDVTEKSMYRLSSTINYLWGIHTENDIYSGVSLSLVIFSETSSIRTFIVNLGDIEVFSCIDNTSKIETFTVEHTVYNLEEKQNVIDRGASITLGGINNQLYITRGIGYKYMEEYLSIIPSVKEIDINTYSRLFIATKEVISNIPKEKFIHLIDSGYNIRDLMIFIEETKHIYESNAILTII